MIIIIKMKDWAGIHRQLRSDCRNASYIRFQFRTNQVMLYGNILSISFH